jgi:predicted acylesterase/phospholipase RssA
MSLTILQKSDLSKPRKNPKIALVLAGGAISGGTFKLGGLIALNRFIRNRKVTEFDIYVCLSAGAFIGCFLAGGVPPDEMLKALNGTSTRFNQFKFYDFYWPAFGEFADRAGRLGKDAVRVWPRVIKAAISHVSANREVIGKRIAEALLHPSYGSAEKVIGPFVSELLNATPLPHAGTYVPSGIFDNSRIERYVRENLALSGIPNDFRMLHRERNSALYIVATNLNTAKGVVFGYDADPTASISQAVQASTAIPGFYVPPRIHGEDYLDAMVRKTANASMAVNRGADLIIIYNPFRPFMNRNRYQLVPTASSLSDLGLGTVLNQTVRTMVHTRLTAGLKKLRLDPSFKGDVILIEPTETDAQFFSINPLAFWNRNEAATNGFNSVRQDLERNFGEVSRILEAYGLDCDLDAIGNSLDDEQPGSTAAARPRPAATTPKEAGAPSRLRIIR